MPTSSRGSGDNAAALLEGPLAAAAVRLRVAVIATGADGAIRHWNAPAERLYGWAREDAISRNVVELNASAQNRAHAEEIMRSLQAGKPWAGEIVLLRRNGLPFTAFVADVPLGPRFGDVIVGASAVAERSKAVLEFHRLLLDALSMKAPPLDPHRRSSV